MERKRPDLWVREPEQLAACEWCSCDGGGGEGIAAGGDGDGFGSCVMVDDGSG